MKSQEELRVRQEKTKTTELRGNLSRKRPKLVSARSITKSGKVIFDHKRDAEQWGLLRKPL